MSKAEAIRTWLRNGGDPMEQQLPDPKRPLDSAKRGNLGSTYRVTTTKNNLFIASRAN